MKKKLKKKAARYFEPDEALIDTIKWVIENTLSFGEGVVAEISVNRRRSPYKGHTLMAVKQTGFFWWRGYHFRLSKDGKKAIRLHLYHRKMFLEMCKVDNLFLRDLQEKYNLRKKKNHDGRK